MFAGLPPSSSELTERKSVVPSSLPADRRREHRESAYFVVARDEMRVPSLLLSTAARDPGCNGSPVVGGVAPGRAPPCCLGSAA
jgi:hypothetical protein